LKDEQMKWNLRMRAAQIGIWKSTEMRRRLADAGLEISAGKMSALWTGTPTSVRLDDLEVICSVLDCTPSDLLILDQDSVAARREAARPAAAANDGPATGPAPRLGRRKSVPPA
jgi:DNA-binding Xre family transcriptional regulator